MDRILLPNTVHEHESARIPSELAAYYEDRNAQYDQRLAKSALLYARHAQYSAVEVSRSMQYAAQHTPQERKIALVVGAGACAEISLSELAMTYDAVDLVDLDTAPVSRALDALQPSHRRVFTVTRADITGSVAAFADLANEAMSTTDTRATEATLISHLPKLPQSSTWGASLSYDFIAVQSVLSEIITAPMQWLDDRLRRAGSPGLASVDLPLLDALRDYRRTTQRAMIERLAGLCLPTGVIHVSDEVRDDPLTMTRPFLEGPALWDISSARQVRQPISWHSPYPDTGQLMVTRAYSPCTGS